MAILIYPEHKVIFVAHVKCAGTTLYNKFGHSWGVNAEIEDYDFVLGKAVGDKNKLSHVKAKYPDYFIFTFIRNPYDRVASFYFYYIQQFAAYRKKSFETFVMKHSNIWRSMPKLVTILDIPVEQIDFIGRYENLTDDIDSVCKLLKVENTNVSHLNKSERRKGINYRDLYKGNARTFVYQRYKEDLEKFDYKF